MEFNGITTRHTDLLDVTLGPPKRIRNLAIALFVRQPADDLGIRIGSAVRLRSPTARRLAAPNPA